MAHLLKKKLVGVIATKDATHIALFFVDGKFKDKALVENCIIK